VQLQGPSLLRGGHLRLMVTLNDQSPPPVADRRSYGAATIR